MKMAANKSIIIPLKHHFAIFEQQGVRNMLHYCCTVLSYALCSTFLFLPHFDVICDLLLNRHMAILNLFVDKHSKLLVSV